MPNQFLIYFYLLMGLMVTDEEAEGVFALSFHSLSVKHYSNFQLIVINFQLISSNEGLWKIIFWRLEEWWISLVQADKEWFMWHSLFHHKN